jgi:hypothetical protein
MNTLRRSAFTFLASVCLSASLASAAAPATDPLPSWNEGQTKRSIVDFVTGVTRQGSSDFVPPAERIATFDNDGTLWAENPLYFQLFFAIDRVKAMAPQHPEWQQTEPFKSILAGDLHAAMAGGKPALMQLLTTAHSGLTTDEFSTVVTTWLGTARHPTTGKRYDQMVYQPMLELLAYLRANDFKTYIVSGGGVDFMRVFSERVYGIPPEQVIGSVGKMEWQLRDGSPVLFKLPAVDFFDDEEGKPIAIQRNIGRRPIASFGNSDGDLQMLQWTAAGSGPRFCLYVHHTDGEREWAYGPSSSIGRLEEGLVEAAAKGWTVVDMKRDWRAIYPPVPN